jgi:hypothetical protein
MRLAPQVDVYAFPSIDTGIPEVESRHSEQKANTLLTILKYCVCLHTVGMIRSHPLDPRDSQAFQSLFGMVLTLLIGLKFKHSLMVVLHHQRNSFKPGP